MKLIDKSMRDLLEPHVHKVDKESPEIKTSIEAINYYGYYFQIAEQQRAKRILEIGVRFGYSGICMLAGSGGEANYTGIDFEEWEGSNEYAKEQLQQHTKGAADLIKANTQQLTALLDGNYDLVHVDGQHTPEAVIHDLDLVDARLSLGGLIIVDDMMMKELYVAALHWAGTKHYPVEFIRSMQGTLLIYKQTIKYFPLVHKPGVLPS